MFISRCKEMYGDQYDYSKAEYKGRETQVVLICKEHGEFSITPRTLLNGQSGRSPHGCPVCYGIPVRVNRTTESMREELLAKYGNKYDFSQSEYHGSEKKVKVICPKHGVFYRLYSTLMRGTSCPKCAFVFDYDNWRDECIRIRNGEFSYPEQERPRTLADKIIVHCNKCGHEWTTRLEVHAIMKCGCPKCKRASSLFNSAVCKSSEIASWRGDFIARAKERYGDRFDYSCVWYKNNKTRVHILCREHLRWFSVSPDTHLRGAGGCPDCVQSVGESLVRHTLEQMGIKFIQQYFIPNENPELKRHHLVLDFYLPDMNVVIEYNGEQHYNDVKHFTLKEGYSFEDQVLRDETVRKYCFEHGLTLIEVPYTKIDCIADFLRKKLKNRRFVR